MKVENCSAVDRKILLPDDMRGFLDRVLSFHGQAEYYSIYEGIAKRNYRARLAFLIARLGGKFTFINVLAMYSILLFYSAYQKPSINGSVAIIDPRLTNKRAIDRVIRAISNGRNSVESEYGEAIGLIDRLKLPWRHADIQYCANLVKRIRWSNPMVHVQALISLSSLLLFGSLKFPPNVRVICVASDHSPVTMALLEVAKRHGLKTCYIQHAPVADHFPPLDYDLSVLSDRESIDTYDRAARRRGVKTKGQIVILPPFEVERVPITLGNAPFRIGICLSYLFRTEALRDFILELDRYPTVSNILLRRHPRSRHDISGLLVAGRVTEPACSSVADFIGMSDIVLVPNSGIAVESLHLGKPTFYTPGMDYISDDYYGFVNRGILPVFVEDMLNNPASLVAFFTSEWQQRYAIYDQTGEIPLATSRQEVREAFLALL